MGQHWIKDIIDNKNAVSGEAEALSNHKERLDALDEKVAKLEESGVDTSNFVTLSGEQTITGMKTFTAMATFQGSIYNAGDLQIFTESGGAMTLSASGAMILGASGTMTLSANGAMTLHASGAMRLEANNGLDIINSENASVFSTNGYNVKILDGVATGSATYHGNEIATTADLADYATTADLADLDDRKLDKTEFDALSQTVAELQERIAALENK